MPDAVAATEAPAAAAEVPPGLPADADLIAALEGQKPADKPTEAKPEAKVADKAKETPKESALMRSLQKREQSLLSAKEQLAQQQAAIPQLVEQGIQKALKERFADPRVAVKTLKDLGLLPQQIAEALVKPDAPSAEELARQAREEVAALRKQLADKEAGGSKTAGEQAFLAVGKGLGDQLTAIHDEWTHQEIIEQAYRFGAELQAECKAKGVPVPNVTDEKVWRILDRRAKSRQDLRTERQKAKEAAKGDVKAASQEATKAAANGSGHQGETTGAPATTTLGRALGERQSVASKDAVLQSDDDVKAQVEEMLRRGVDIKAR